MGREGVNAWLDGDSLLLGEMGSRNQEGTPRVGWNTYAHDRHALAALALHGQPFGFTSEDVDAIHRLLSGAEDPSDWYGATTPDERNAVVSRVLSLAGRIAALLPPREV